MANGYLTALKSINTEYENNKNTRTEKKNRAGGA